MVQTEMGSQLLKTLGRCIRYTVGFGLLGAILFGVAGYLFGAWSSHSYVPRGPTDPGDAPIYVQLGLTLICAIAGGVLGAIGGIAMAVFRRSRVSRDSHASAI